MEGMIGQVMLFAGNFAPRSWAFCDGQLLAISQNTALFSILGTTYGGDGRTTFGLPDLRGRCAIGPRTGPGLSNRSLGQKGGTETNTLNTTQIPSHGHSFVVNASGEPGTSAVPAAGVGPAEAETDIYGPSSASTVAMFSGSTGNTGGNQPVNNMQPYLAINYIIALIGIYPSRN